MIRDERGGCADKAEQEALRLQAILNDVEASHAASHSYYSRQLDAALDNNERLVEKVEEVMGPIREHLWAAEAAAREAAGRTRGTSDLEREEDRLAQLTRELAEERHQSGKARQEAEELRDQVSRLQATIEVDQRELAQDRALLLKGRQEKEALKKEVQKSGLKHAACAEKVAYLEVSIGLKSS